MKLSAYTKHTQFLSHPIEDGKLLIDHLIKVANSARNLSSELGLNCHNAAYYAGLLHDIGKLNPWYQQIFHADNKQRESVKELTSQEYEQSHAPFSSWAALKLLGEKTGLDEKSIDIVIHAIYGHHSSLKNIIPVQDKTEKYKNSQMAISDFLKDFADSVKNCNGFSALDWDLCISQFQRPITFKSELKSDEGNYLFDFLKSSCVYSALLQADRGSFDEWCVPSFGIHFDTDGLIHKNDSDKAKSKLGHLREAFQKHALENHDATSGVLVLEAPTGIGKTKVFLDLVTKYQKVCTLERVYYFSPLLALTEDFENKIFGIVRDQERQRILVYNHLFSGSLEDKSKESGVSGVYHWDFENESFNKEFIITTTQRLLTTLFSNRQSDKLKLLSLKNSLLIIDEVQTIPKLILPVLVGLFEHVANYLHSKILLISATIPDELKNVKKITIQNEIREEYLQKTLKKISFLEQFEIPNELSGSVLFMSNTRKKNLAMYELLSQKFKNIIYMSSGITKNQRHERLAEIKPNSIVVSTQVIEAGVDVSFDQMYREAAPLDNIIQAMGRLNREGKNNNAVMTVFKYAKDDWLPYSKLEWQESLKVIKNVQSSIDLYNELRPYYQRISEENKINEESSKKLARLITNLDYEGIWKFVKENALPDDDQEAVFVPENQVQWNQIKNTFFSKDDLERKRFRRFAHLTANLPKSPEKIGIVDYFDAELYEKNILLPKWEYVDIVYDKIVGLDKWVKDVIEK